MRRGSGLAATCAIFPIILSCSCSSDKSLVENATAAYIWDNHIYVKACVEQKGPPTCSETYSQLKTLRDDTVVANEAQKVGKLPKSARKKLKSLMKSLDK